VLCHCFDTNFGNSSRRIVRRLCLLRRRKNRLVHSFSNCHLLDDAGRIVTLSVYFSCSQARADDFSAFLALSLIDRIH